MNDLLWQNDRDLPFFITILCAVAGVLLQKADYSEWMNLLLFLFPGGFLLAGGKRGAVLFMLLLCFLGLSGRFYRSRTGVFLPFPKEDILILQGTLKEEPSWNARGELRIVLELEEAENQDGLRGNASGTVRTGLKGAYAPETWCRGDSIRIRGGFSRGSYPYFYGSRVLLISKTNPGDLRADIHRALRNKAARLGPRSAVLLPALVLGLRDPQMEGVASLFRQSGTAHIIALSGFHSGLVAFILYFCFSVLFGKRAALVLAGAGLVFYLWLAGPKPSLFRSVLMYLLLAGTKLGHRKIDMVNLLLASWFITALIAPESLHGLSSSLSYLALFGILKTAPVLCSLGERFLPRKLLLPLAAGLGAQIWTLPLVLITFGVWYPAGLLASLVLTPLVSLFMFSGLAFLLLPGIAGTPFASACILLEKGLSRCAAFFQSMPSVTLSGEKGAGLFLILLFPLLLGLIYRPGGLHGKGKSRSQLRFHIGDKSPSGNDGPGAPQALGAEFSH